MRPVSARVAISVTPRPTVTPSARNRFAITRLGAPNTIPRARCARFVSVEAVHSTVTIPTRPRLVAFWVSACCWLSISGASPGIELTNAEYHCASDVAVASSFPVTARPSMISGTRDRNAA